MRSPFPPLGLFLVSFSIVGCSLVSQQMVQQSRQQPPLSQPHRLTVLAAASLTEPFGEIGVLFEARKPYIQVDFSFANSQQLAQQLSQGAPADVFASASPKYMSATIDTGRVREQDSQIFAGNQLVVIYPKDNPAGIEELADLAKPGLKLVLCAEEVPAGEYALEFLDKAVRDPSFDPTFKEQTLKNVVSYEQTVRAALAKIVLGEADASIVYLSDISQGFADQVGSVAIPDALNVIATYPIAFISDSQNLEGAQAFIDLVLSPEGQAVLAKYNFIPAAKLPSP